MASISIDESVPPVAQIPRKIPVNMEALVATKLAEMESKGIIKKVTGHARWQSPIVLAKKRDGGIRICVDMRLANRCVLKETHPMLTIDTLSSKLKGATVFSKLDIKEAFHQIRIDEKSSELTTFCTHLGLYRYCVLMFGLSTAPELFQRIMNQYVLSGLEGVLALIDDLIVWGETIEIHDLRLKALLRRLEELNVRINEAKCVFRQKELVFGGHVFNKDGIRPTHDKVETLDCFQVPTSKSEVKSFLGLLSYVGARHIPNLSSLNEPLR